MATHIHIHRTTDNFEESKHPRESDGKFGSGGGGSSGEKPRGRVPEGGLSTHKAGRAEFSKQVEAMKRGEGNGEFGGSKASAEPKSYRGEIMRNGKAIRVSVPGSPNTPRPAPTTPEQRSRMSVPSSNAEERRTTAPAKPGWSNSGNNTNIPEPELKRPAPGEGKTLVSKGAGINHTPHPNPESLSPEQRKQRIGLLETKLNHMTEKAPLRYSAAVSQELKRLRAMK